MKIRSTATLFGALLALGIAGCSDPEEAPRVELPVAVSADQLQTVTTDLGYEVELSEARTAVDNLAFTIAGEAHTQLWQPLQDMLIPSAYAHPGHYAGGEVTGEMPGHFIIDWLAEDGRELGVGELLAGNYTGLNFGFSRAGEDDVDADDPLFGHTAIFSGVAKKDGAQTEFTIIVDSPKDRELVGGVFGTEGADPLEGYEATISSGASGTLYFRLASSEPIENKTLFDGVDFAALDADSQGSVYIEPEVEATEDAYNKFRRSFQLGDFYGIFYEE